MRIDDKDLADKDTTFAQVRKAAMEHYNSDLTPIRSKHSSKKRRDYSSSSDSDSSSDSSDTVLTES